MPLAFRGGIQPASKSEATSVHPYIRMMDEGDAIRAQSPRKHAEVRLDDIGFDVYQRVKAEYEVDAHVANRSERSTVIHDI